MSNEALNIGFFGLFFSLFGLIGFLGFVGVIFYWIIKAYVKKDEKLRKEILKPFPYILVGSVLTIIIRNALLGEHGLFNSTLPFLSAFFLGFVSYSIAINYHEEKNKKDKEINHFKALLVTLFVYLAILIYTINM